MTQKNSLPTWDDTEEIASDLPSWDATEEIKNLDELESARKGFFNGASLSYKDELAGLIEAAGAKMGIRGLGTKPLGEQRWETDEEDKQDFADTYRQGRDAVRAEEEQHRKANPKSYLLGNAGGNVFTSVMLPGSVGANTYKAVTAMGGAAGLGESDADLTKGDIKGAVIDTATGAAIAPAVKFGIDKVATPVVKGIGNGVSKIANSDKAKAVKDYLLNKSKSATELVVKKGLDLPDEVIGAIKADKDLLGASKNAKPMSGLIDDLGKSLDDSSKMISEADTKAWNSLKEIDDSLADIPGYENGYFGGKNTNKTIQDVADMLAKEHNLIGANQQAQKNALNALNNAKADAANIETFADLKAFIQRLDANINWDNPADSAKNKVLKEYRTKLDGILKGDEQYTKQMDIVASKLKNQNEIKTKFSMKPEFDTEAGEASFRPTNNSVANLETALRQAFREKGEFKMEQLAELNPQLAKNMQAKSMDMLLNADTGRGSRSVLTGASVLDGIPVAGAVAGYARDKFGRKLGAAIIQQMEHGGFSKILNKVGGKYAKQLIDAAAKGNKSLIITHTLLMKNDPEYRAAVENENN